MPKSKLMVNQKDVFIAEVVSKDVIQKNDTIENIAPMKKENRKAKKEGTTCTWGNPDMAVLINARTSPEFMAAYAACKTKNEMNLRWQDIVAELASKGFVRTVQQCQSKLKKMRIQYKEIQSELSRNSSGRGPEDEAKIKGKLFMYECFEKLLGNNATMDPVAHLDVAGSPRGHASGKTPERRKRKHGDQSEALQEGIQSISKLTEMMQASLEDEARLRRQENEELKESKVKREKKEILMFKIEMLSRIGDKDQILSLLHQLDQYD